MGMNALAVGIVLLSGYLWMTRGYFSAFLNLLCVVAAGAVAFAVWEPFAYAILNAVSEKDWYGDIVLGSAFGIALGLPFTVVLAVLRFGVDGFLRRNAQVGTTADYVGGGVCGLLAGVVVSGFAVLTFGMLRFPADGGMLDYRPANFGAQGAVIRDAGLWVPTDKIVAGLYGRMSDGSFCGSESLSKWYPNLDMVPALLRQTASDGNGRHYMKADQVRIEGRYVVDGGKDGKGVDALLVDRWRPEKQAGVTDIEGKAYPAGSKLHGYVLHFQSGAKEKNGQVVIGNAQVRLLAKAPDGTTQDFFPFAALSKRRVEEVGDQQLRKKTELRDLYARFPYNSQGIVIPSIGGDADAKMGFEFILPDRYEPVALFVRNVRLPLDATAPTTYASTGERDGAIERFMNGRGGTPSNTPLDASKAVQVQVTPDAPVPQGWEISNRLPNGLALQKDQVGPGIDLEEVERGGWAITAGSAIYMKAELKGSNMLDKNLRVNGLATSSDTVIVQLDVSTKYEWTIAEKGLALDQSISMIDKEGNRFDAAGYYFTDGERVYLSYTPNQSLRLKDLPKQLSRSNSDFELVLFFRVTKGAVVTGFAVGDRALATVKPGIATKQ